MEENPELEYLILSTLSFYESMSFSKIVFDMDTEVLKSYPNFDKKQMESLLKTLERKALIKRVSTQKGNETEWQRVHKKRTFWSRFF